MASQTQQVGVEKKKKLMREVAAELDINDLFDIGSVKTPGSMNHLGLGSGSTEFGFGEISHQTGNRAVMYESTSVSELADADFDEGSHQTESVSVSEVSGQNLDKNSEISTRTSLKDIMEKQTDHDGDIECGNMELEISPLTNPNKLPSPVAVQAWPSFKPNANACKITQRKCCMLGMFGVLLLVGIALAVFIFKGGDKGGDEQGNPGSDSETDNSDGVYAVA